LTTDIPRLCECGCGQPTKKADRRCKKYGYEMGDYRRFILGHGNPNNINTDGLRRWQEENKKTALQRFLEKIDIIEGSDCIVWAGSLRCMGYGKIQVGEGRKKEELAHRFSYKNFVGPISEGMQIDHICMNRACVNPSHLRVVTPRDNKVFNSNSAAAKNLIKTHCPKGHEYTPENTLVKKKSYGFGRECRTCDLARKREASRKSRLAKREEATA